MARAPELLAGDLFRLALREEKGLTISQHPMRLQESLVLLPSEADFRVKKAGAVLFGAVLAVPAYLEK